MGLTLGQAAETCGKSKAALSKAISGGRLSATKKEDGSFDIDPAELDRWMKNVARTQPKKQLTETLDSVELIIANSELKAQLNAATEEKNLWKERATDLKAERDDWKKQAQTLLLTAPPKQSLWQWLLGRKTA